MPKPKVVRKENGDALHFSAGALIEKDGKYLLIDRVHPPQGFAGLAGHIDEGESPEETIVREVKEESGLTIVSKKLLLEGEFAQGECCSRGVKPHYWYLFQCEVTGDIQENEEEVKSIRWYALEEVKQLNLEPVWEHWFKKLNLF